MIFNDIQWFSTIFHDFQRFSMIVNDFQSFSTPATPRQHPGKTTEVREAPGPRLGAQRRKIRLFKTIDLGATVMEIWPPDCIVYLLFSRFWIYIFAAWSAKYQLLIGIFLGIRIPLTRPSFEAQNDDFEHLIHKENHRSCGAAGFATFCPINWRKWVPAGTYLSRAWLQDDVSMAPPNSLKLLQQ